MGQCKRKPIALGTELGTAPALKLVPASDVVKRKLCLPDLMMLDDSLVIVPKFPKVNISLRR